MSELEQIARRLCRLRGLDPDELAAGFPRWQFMAAKIIRDDQPIRNDDRYTVRVEFDGRPFDWDAYLEHVRAVAQRNAEIVIETINDMQGGFMEYDADYWRDGAQYQLAKFYAVHTKEALIEAQAAHVEKLQAKLRELQPLRDTESGRVREG